MTKLSIKLSSLAVTLLHIDPVFTPTSGAKVSPEDDNAHPLACMADKFFSNLGTYGFGGKDFDDMAEKFVSACTADHLRYGGALAMFSTMFLHINFTSHMQFVITALTHEISFFLLIFCNCVYLIL